MEPGDFVYFHGHVAKYYGRVETKPDYLKDISLMYINGTIHRSTWWGLGTKLTMDDLLTCIHIGNLKEEPHKAFIKEALMFLAKD